MVITDTERQGRRRRRRRRIRCYYNRKIKYISYSEIQSKEQSKEETLNLFFY